MRSKKRLFANFNFGAFFNMLVWKLWIDITFQKHTGHKWKFYKIILPQGRRIFHADSPYDKSTDHETKQKKTLGIPGKYTQNIARRKVYFNGSKTTVAKIIVRKQNFTEIISRKQQGTLITLMKAPCDRWSTFTSIFRYFVIHTFVHKFNFDRIFIQFSRIKCNPKV